MYVSIHFVWWAISQKRTNGEKTLIVSSGILTLSLPTVLERTISRLLQWKRPDGWANTNPFPTDPDHCLIQHRYRELTIKGLPRGCVCIILINYNRIVRLIGRRLVWYWTLDLHFELRQMMIVLLLLSSCLCLGESGYITLLIHLQDCLCILLFWVYDWL